MVESLQEHSSLKSPWSCLIDCVEFRMNCDMLDKDGSSRYVLGSAIVDNDI